MQTREEQERVGFIQACLHLPITMTGLTYLPRATATAFQILTLDSLLTNSNLELLQAHGFWQIQFST